MKHTWTYTYHIPATIEHVYAYLSEPANYIGLSPLVTRVYNVTWDEAHRVCEYVSVEHFRFFGFIPYDNHIKVTMTLTQANQRMLTEVHSPFRVHLLFEYVFEAVNGETQIAEIVTVSMPAIVQNFVVSEAQRVQKERGQILAERLKH